MQKEPMDLTSQLRVVLVTVPDVDTGCSLARRVVGERLAACGNVIPGLTSVYRWDGKVQEDSEALVIFKTTERVLPDLERRVLELHPYEVPEFLALSITDGHFPYLRWVVGELIEPETSQ
jgi:periplasmic divalent cation tolerance protein